MTYNCFAEQADIYAEYRPEYSTDLFEFLSSLLNEHEYAWDCGTGNGQVTSHLRKNFKQIIATDSSYEQLLKAPNYNNVNFTVANAETAPLNDSSINLVTVAEAIHWFNINLFFKEVQRILKPNGIVAVWCYKLAPICPAVQEVVKFYDTNILAQHWPRQVQTINECYRNIPFPFDEIKAPQFFLKKEWNLESFIGYMDTWSAAQQFRNKKGYNATINIKSDLEQQWGDPTQKREICWPIHIRVGRFK